jgi:hypothetical protein
MTPLDRNGIDSVTGDLVVSDQTTTWQIPYLDTALVIPKGQ